MARRKIFEAVINAAAELRKLGGTTAERMARAAEQNYGDTLYHATASDFTQFSTDGKGKTSEAGAFLTSSPLNAETYAPGIGSGAQIMPVRVRAGNDLVLDAKGGRWNDIGAADLSAGRGRNAFKTLGIDPREIVTTDDIARAARERGYDSVTINNIIDAGPNTHMFRAKEYIKNKYGVDVADDWSNITGDQFAEARDAVEAAYNSPTSITAVFDPSRIRSVNADFNPEYRDSPNLLAGIAGAMPYAGATAAALAGATGSQEAEAGPLQALGRAAPYLTSAALGGAAALQSGDAEAGKLDALGRAAPYLATGALGAAMMTPQDAQAEPISIMPPTYNDTMQRTQAAINKIDQFKAKRAGKRGAMDIMKLELQTLLKGANEVANDVIFPALDKPLQGYLGLSEVFGSLAQGKGFDTAMQRGAQVATQPVDTTTYNMGGTVTDSLSPYVPAPVAAGAGALTHAGALLASPF